MSRLELVTPVTIIPFVKVDANVLGPLVRQRKLMATVPVAATLKEALPPSAIVTVTGWTVEEEGGKIKFTVPHGAEKSCYVLTT